MIKTVGNGMNYWKSIKCNSMASVMNCCATFNLGDVEPTNKNIRYPREPNLQLSFTVDMTSRANESRSFL